MDLSITGSRVLILLGALAARASAAEPLNVASPGFTLVSVDADTGNLYADYFARQLELRGDIHVTGAAELSAVVGLEKQRQLLGCKESGCVAELAGAMGASYVIIGQLGRAGSGWIVNIKIVSSRDASTVAVYSTRVEGDNALLDYLGRSADDLARRLGRATAPKTEPTASAPSAQIAAAESPDRTWVATGSVGVALIIAAGVCYGISAGQRDSLAQGGQSYGSVVDVANARFSGERLEATSFALGATGIAALGLAVAQWTLPPASSIRRSAPWAVGGALLVVGVVLDAAAHAQQSQLQQGAYPTLSAFEAARSTGENEQAAGLTLVATGALGLANSAFLTFMPRGAPRVAAAASPHGAGVTVSMELP